MKLFNLLPLTRKSPFLMNPSSQIFSSKTQRHCKFLEILVYLPISSILPEKSREKTNSAGSFTVQNLRKYFLDVFMYVLKRKVRKKPIHPYYTFMYCEYVFVRKSMVNRVYFIMLYGIYLSQR